MSGAGDHQARIDNLILEIVTQEITEILQMPSCAATARTAPLDVIHLLLVISGHQIFVGDALTLEHAKINHSASHIATLVMPLGNGGNTFKGKVEDPSFTGYGTPSATIAIGDRRLRHQTTDGHIHDIHTFALTLRSTSQRLAASVMDPSPKCKAPMKSDSA